MMLLQRNEASRLIVLLGNVVALMEACYILEEDKNWWVNQMVNIYSARENKRPIDIFKKAIRKKLIGRESLVDMTFLPRENTKLTYDKATRMQIKLADKLFEIVTN